MDDTPLPFDTTSAAVTYQHPQYVGFRRRLGARAIDVAVHYFAAFGGAVGIAVAAALIERSSGRAAGPILNSLQHPSVPAFFLGMFGATAYHTVMEGLHGSTAGKLVCKIVVLREDNRPCGLTAALIRSLAIFFDGLFFGLLADISMRSSQRQQRYGDTWAHTVVVRRASAPPEISLSWWRFLTVFLFAIVLDGCIMCFDAVKLLVAP